MYNAKAIQENSKDKTKMITDDVRRRARFLVFTAWLAYTLAYVGRLNYSASIVEIISQTGAGKEAAGAVSSFFYAAYGAGQLINGLLSKKYNPRISVAVALIGSAAANLAMTLCPGVYAMRFVWFLNGAFQSVLWSSIVKETADLVPADMLPNAAFALSSPVAVGTFGAYGLAALFSALKMKYTFIFYISAVLLVFAGIFWFLSVGKLQKKLPRAIAEQSAGERKKLKLTPVFVITGALLLLASVSNGFIKDGITTWTPSVLTESFGVEKSVSIIITLVLPLMGIIGAWIARTVYKRIKGDGRQGMLYFGITTVLLTAGLLTLPVKSVPLTVVLFAATACIMMAENTLITSLIPMNTKDKSNSGLVAGLFDTFVYLGSSIGTVALGGIAEKRTWNAVFLCLVIVAGFAFVINAAEAFLPLHKGSEETEL